MRKAQEKEERWRAPMTDLDERIWRRREGVREGGGERGRGEGGRGTGGLNYIIN